MVKVLTFPRTSPDVCGFWPSKWAIQVVSQRRAPGGRRLSPAVAAFLATEAAQEVLPATSGGGIANRAIQSRIATNRSRVTATSASWNITYFACRVALRRQLLAYSIELRKTVLFEDNVVALSADTEIVEFVARQFARYLTIRQRWDFYLDSVPHWVDVCHSALLFWLLSGIRAIGWQSENR